ncbi:unnamed protein product [Rangifer tarandus platyrhynchus]|uniref:Uncharacterized protein n=1 Tax=Rangifer tarandus platyrhynchus TaxID=3082113 RepID=A0AC59ZZ78_RANTA
METVLYGGGGRRSSDPRNNAARSAGFSPLSVHFSLLMGRMAPNGRLPDKSENEPPALRRLSRYPPPRRVGICFGEELINTLR